MSESTTASDMTPDSRSSTIDPPAASSVPAATPPAIPSERAFAFERAARVRAESQVFGRDHVLSVASHDLRGPLNAIHTWAHVLERKLGDADPSIGRALAGIRAGVEQQVGLIEKIIDAPRIATRHLAIVRSRASLAAICDDVVANARITLGPGDLSYAWQGDAREADVDAERLWQAWWCLLAYAREQSQAAAGNAAALTAIGAPSDAAALRVSVEQGVCTTTLTCAAAPAERASHEHQLTLPRRVAEAHGGQCTFESNDETGELTIVMVFPLTGR
ncbi:sensor histidine kinase [Pararobbsia silviterrae]|uniref:sensor histidine kinase n=1 Tax=Pararobbsia silviterrae TaxID=1792498 RepID=UPI001F0BF4E1|nr:histidine kinase dimerization/phospho-acceptor domain-containing protein [Pararobbsia silviterrae]